MGHTTSKTEPRPSFLATVTADIMRFAFPSLSALVLVAARVNARAATSLYSRTSTDTCGNLDKDFEVPFLGTEVNLGPLSKRVLTIM